MVWASWQLVKAGDGLLQLHDRRHNRAEQGRVDGAPVGNWCDIRREVHPVVNPPQVGTK